MSQFLNNTTALTGLLRELHSKAASPTDQYEFGVADGREMYGTKTVLEGKTLKLTHMIKQPQEVTVQVAEGSVAEGEQLTIKTIGSNLFNYKASNFSHSWEHSSIADNADGTGVTMTIVSTPTTNSYWSHQTPALFTLKDVHSIYISGQVQGTGGITFGYILPYLINLDTNTEISISSSYRTGDLQGTNISYVLNLPDQYKTDQYGLRIYLYSTFGEAASLGATITYSNLMISLNKEEFVPYIEYDKKTIETNQEATLDIPVVTKSYIVTDKHYNIKTSYWQEGGQLFNAGAQDCYDTFWDSLQQCGKLTNYKLVFAGRGWSSRNFYPKYDIRPTASMSACFQESGSYGVPYSLIERLNECGVVLDTSKCAAFSTAFYSTYFTELPFIDMSANTSSLSQIFQNSTSLETIHLKLPTSKGNWTTPFQNMPALKNVKLEGTFITNGVSFAWSKQLTRESIENIVQALSLSPAVSSPAITISTTAVNNAFETSPGAADGSQSQEWADLIAPYDAIWAINLLDA